MFIETIFQDSDPKYPKLAELPERHGHRPDYDPIFKNTGKMVKNPKRHQIRQGTSLLSALQVSFYDLSQKSP